MTMDFNFTQTWVINVSGSIVINGFINIAFVYIFAFIKKVIECFHLKSPLTKPETADPKFLISSTYFLNLASL